MLSIKVSRPSLAYWQASMCHLIFHEECIHHQLHLPSPLQRTPPCHRRCRPGCRQMALSQFSATGWCHGALFITSAAVTFLASVDQLPGGALFIIGAPGGRSQRASNHLPRRTCRRRPSASHSAPALITPTATRERRQNQAAPSLPAVTPARAPAPVTAPAPPLPPPPPLPSGAV